MSGLRRILITNDDGLGAIGIHILATVLASRYDVYVVAPDQERSGVSHAFTLMNPIRADAAPDAFPPDLVKSAYRCSGTPVDCVKMGLLQLHSDVEFDLVVAGINRGANMSLDTLYSGTVAGAMEAVLMGRPAVAISLVSMGRETASHEHFQGAAEWLLRYLDTHGHLITANRACVLNVNVPGIPEDQIKGFRYTVVGRAKYKDYYRTHQDPFGRPYYWLEGERVLEDKRPESDLMAVQEGYVSITPLGWDLTSQGGFEALQEWKPRKGTLPAKVEAKAPPTPPKVAKTVARSAAVAPAKGRKSAR